MWHVRTKLPLISHTVQLLPHEQGYLLSFRPNVHNSTVVVVGEVVVVVVLVLVEVVVVVLLLLLFLIAEVIDVDIVTVKVLLEADVAEIVVAPVMNGEVLKVEDGKLFKHEPIHRVTF